MRNTIARKIHNAVKLLSADFTAATTDIITSASHGLSNGDAVILTTTGTLPAGLSTETIYYVIAATTNTFKLSTDKPDGVNDTPAVDITDTGTGTHTFTVASVGQALYVGDHRHKELIISTSGMASGDSVTCKVQGSSQDSSNPPDFHKAQSSTNEWDYIEIVDQNTGDTVDGDTGVTIADSDDIRKFAINIDGLTWINVAITDFTDANNSGSLTAEVRIYND